MIRKISILVLGVLLLTGCADKHSIDLNVYEKEGIFSVLVTEDIMTMAQWKEWMYAAGTDGVYRISLKDNYAAEKVSFSREISYVKTMHVDASEKIWIGYENGILVYNPQDNSEVYYDENDFLPGKRVNVIIQDDKGIFWIGTWEGVCYGGGSNWNSITKKEGLIQDNVNVICQDNIGGMWFWSYAVRDGGVSYLKDNEWKIYDVKNGLPNENITAIFQDSEGILWIGGGMYTQGGAVGLTHDGYQWQITEHLSVKKGLAGEKVRSIYQDSRGRLYFGSEYDGLSIISHVKTIITDETNGLVQNEPKIITEDNNGNIWVGTRYGISVFSDFKSEKNNNIN